MSIVPKKKFGSSGAEVSILGLGCMSMSDFYGDDRNEEESLNVIKTALDAGINFFDTADVYGPLKNEILLGKAIKQFGREKFFIATKFGHLRSEDGTWLGIDCKPDYVRKACEASLKRLGVDTIDLYYMHRLDKTVPIEETVGALKQLVLEGKVRYIGLSEVGPENIRRAHAVHPITALQSEYSLWSLDIREKIIPVCRELGIAIVPYSPLGRGFLTGQIKTVEDLPKDIRSIFPRFQPENFDKNIVLVRKVEELAKSKNASPSQIALAWILAQGDDMFPIPGTKKIKYLEDNIGSVNVKLSEEEFKQIESWIEEFAPSGLRFPARNMAAIDTN